MTMTLRCTHCDQAMSIAPRKPGSRVECPVCGRSVTVPGSEAAATATKDRRTALAPPAVETRTSTPRPSISKPATPETVVNPAGQPSAAQVDVRGQPAAFAPRVAAQVLEREPWYYSFVELYAKVLLWVVVTLLSLSFLSALVAVVVAVNQGLDLAQAGALLFAIMIWFGVLLLVGILVPAALLLLVDLGRNVRALRKSLDRS